MATLKNTDINDTGFLKLPIGTTAQRPTPSNGMMRLNTTLNSFEIYYGTTWKIVDLTEDTWGWSTSWIQNNGSEIIWVISANSISGLTNMSYQVLTVHANPIIFPNVSQVTGNANHIFYSGVFALPPNTTTYTLVYYKTVSGVTSEVFRTKLVNRLGQ